VTEHTDYTYLGPFCLVVNFRVEPRLNVGVSLGLSPPSIDLYILLWLFSLTSRAHGRECQGLEREQREIAALEGAA
jgi:hypothetical protein